MSLLIVIVRMPTDIGDDLVLENYLDNFDI
jgi:hypothetical protein